MQILKFEFSSKKFITVSNELPADIKLNIILLSFTFSLNISSFIIFNESMLVHNKKAQGV